MHCTQPRPLKKALFLEAALHCCVPRLQLPEDKPAGDMGGMGGMM
jgi:hypothetical protein